MVKMSFSYIEQIDDLPTRLDHIRAIKDVCEKKIFLEVSHLIIILIFFQRLNMPGAHYYW